MPCLYAQPSYWQKGYNDALAGGLADINRHELPHWRGRCMTRLVRGYQNGYIAGVRAWAEANRKKP